MYNIILYIIYSKSLHHYIPIFAKWYYNFDWILKNFVRLQKDARIYKSREEFATPFFGDARFPTAFDSPILMKLSGFDDYKRRARWSELPMGCFNNRGKFNIDGRRINNSRITNGGDAFVRAHCRRRGKSRAWKRDYEILGDPHSRARLFHYDLSLKTLSVCVASNVAVIYRLVPPSYLLSPLLPFLHHQLSTIEFLISFWNTNGALNSAITSLRFNANETSLTGYLRDWVKIMDHYG